MIKDLFADVIRRMEWARDRRLEPEILNGRTRRQLRIPVDDSKAYVVSIREDGEHRTLMQSFFPDGEPHHHFKIDRLDFNEALCLLDAASLIVYGRLIRPS